MEDQNYYWEVEDYSGMVITLLKEGKKIYSKKLTKNQVEEKIGKKLKVCPSHLSPQIIVGARVEENGIKYLDNRTSLRGTTQRCYLIQ